MKKIISILLCLALCFGMIASFGSGVSASGTQSVQDGLYTFKNVSSGYMLNVYAGKDANGTKVTTWEYDGTTDQRIYIQHQGNGKYLLKFNASSGGRVVDVNRGESLTASIDDGDKIDIWTANDLDAQYFYIIPCGNGAYTFELVSKPGHVIAAVNNSAAASNGTQLQLKKYTGSDCQKWYICNTNGSKISVCNHINTKNKELIITYEQSSDTHHKTVTKYDVVCNDCGETVKSNQTSSKEETHIMNGNSCSKCGYAEAVSEECKHTKTYEIGSGKTGEFKRQKDEKYHICTEYVDIICAYCSKTLQHEVEKEIEVEHVFNGDYCMVCNYDKSNKKAEASTLTANKTQITAGESIDFTWSRAEYANCYDLHMYKDGKRVNLFGGLQGLKYTYKFDESGVYDVGIYSINNNGDYTVGTYVRITVNEKVTTRAGYVYNTDGANLNMRAQATTKSAIVGKIPEGRTVTVTGNAVNGFYPITYGGKSGYGHSDYITFTKPTGSSSTVVIKNSKTEQKKSQLSSMMNGSTYGGAYKIGKQYTGPYHKEQCKGFAKSVFMQLFGYNIGSTTDGGYGYQINYSSSKTTHLGTVTSMTVTNVKNLFLKARPGDFVQMKQKGSYTGPHSAIVYEVSESGVTFYECNLDWKNTISKKYYSWTEIVSGKSAISVYTAKGY